MDNDFALIASTDGAVITGGFFFKNWNKQRQPIINDVIRKNQLTPENAAVLRTIAVKVKDKTAKINKAVDNILTYFDPKLDDFRLISANNTRDENMTKICQEMYKTAKIYETNKNTVIDVGNSLSWKVKIHDGNLKKLIKVIFKNYKKCHQLPVDDNESDSSSWRNSTFSGMPSSARTSVSSDTGSSNEGRSLIDLPSFKKNFNDETSRLKFNDGTKIYMNKELIEIGSIENDRLSMIREDKDFPEIYGRIVSRDYNLFKVNDSTEARIIYDTLYRNCYIAVIYKKINTGDEFLIPYSFSLLEGSQCSGVEDVLEVAVAEAKMKGINVNSLRF